MGDTIEINKEEYQELVRAQMKLESLEAVGVDNWEGYDAAMEILDHLLNNVGV